MLGFVKKRKTLFFSVFLSAFKPFEFSVKNAIKWVQSQTCLSYAEREYFGRSQFDLHLDFKRFVFSLQTLHSYIFTLNWKWKVLLGNLMRKLAYSTITLPYLAIRKGYYWDIHESVITDGGSDFRMCIYSLYLKNNCFLYIIFSSFWLFFKKKHYFCKKYSSQWTSFAKLFLYLPRDGKSVADMT